MRLQARLLTAVAALVLSACGASTVTVEGNYPSPAVAKIPVTLGVIYTDALRDFTYVEYSESGKEEYLVQSGQSHVELFNSVLPSMFDRVVPLPNEAAAASSGVDLVFIPAIEEFQLALPQKTRLDSYEVWVKYNMRLITPDGAQVADWVLTAYGKTSTETMQSTETGINDATTNALRDLGSNFSLSFSNVPDVREWLNNQRSL